MKRVISLILAMMMVFVGLPIGEFIAYGAGTDARIDNIIINKTYNSLEDLGQFFITITGDNLDTAQIQILKANGELLKPVRSQNSGRYVAQYTHDASEVGERLFINGKTYSLGEGTMPRITGRDGNTDNIIEKDQYVTLTGERIENLREGKALGIKAYFSQAGSNVELVEENIVGDGKDTKIVKNVGSTLGIHSLIFKQTTKANEIPIEIEHTYKSIIIVRGELTVTGDTTMFPTQGPIDSLVTVTANKIESNISVFFMKKGEEYKYTKSNMALNTSITHTKETGKEKISFRVPKEVKNGSYDIIFTNRIDFNKDIDSQITKYKVLGNMDKGIFRNLEFLVVDGESAAKLKGITPNYSSIKGKAATIEGTNIGRISPNLYEGVKPPIVNISKDGTDKVKDLILTYEGGKYDGKLVNKISRKITIQIGTMVSFTGYNFDGDPYDYLNIIVPENDNPGIPIKDVILSIENEIEFADGTKVTQVEGDTLQNAFTYKQMDYKPTVNTITPNIIQVDDKGLVTEDVVISIIGENFLKYGYREAGKLRIKTPEISINNQAGSSTWFENTKIRIYDKSGKELEDKLEEQFGNAVKITIIKGSSIPEELINNPASLKLQNPLAIESESSMGGFDVGEIRFVKVGAGKTPNITKIDPNIVTTQGENGVKITGSDFGTGVKVYIDGEEIKGAKRNGTGTEIIFNAPPRPEGTYQIMVQNEEGGLAIYKEFVYVKTYTEIKLNDFNPKKGGANTLVTIKGENFVKPNPLVSNLDGMGVYKLIGTRVFLSDRDVNEYHMEKSKITLQNYESSKENKIIKIDGNRLKLSDYYHSVILEDEVNKKYYTLEFDTNSGDIKLTDGDKIEYIIGKKGEELVAIKGGKESTLTVNEGSLQIGEDLTLNFKTPYKVDKATKEITGNNVKVINNNELIFNVPPMPREGYYDLTVMNPDTKKDSKTGNNGFYYSFQPEYNPTIENINPNEGSVDGDYYINISGKGFLDQGGDKKTSVIIGNVVVNPNNVEVSVDGKNLKVKVPKYPGDLASETDMDRKTVAVVVVNPDGGSDSMKEGFSYIIPISHPKITKLILSKGSAAGDEFVTIEGSGFRFFEPFKDENNNGQYDYGEDFTDLNDNKIWDDYRYWFSEENKKEYDKLVKDKEEYNKLVKPILPKVYFGGKQVEITGFTGSTIEVRTPKGAKGNVEVYVVNNDYGVSNKLNYTYESSNPKITSITPGSGRKQGQDKVEILGEGFGSSGVQVHFGNMSDKNISNSTIALQDQYSGRIRDNQTTVKVEDLIVKYDATKSPRKLTFSIEVDKTTTHGPVEVSYNDGEIFFDVSELKDSKGIAYPRYEKVRVNLERIEGSNVTSRLRVDRGFSPRVESLNPKQVLVQTPSYYTIGKVPVTLINIDGGTATTNFEYKNPDSNPAITNILRDGQSGYKVEDGRIIVEVPYTGGNTMEVIGRDFRGPVKITIGDFEVKSKIEYSPEGESISTKLTFQMPAMDGAYIGKDLRVTVLNEDGGLATSEPIYIHLTKPESTDLAITKVTPNFGPTAGGTTVTIEGKDFRKTMDGKKGLLKVYFGKDTNQVLVPESDIISVSFDKIVLKTPPYTAGLTDIKVENPDGNIVVLKDGFKYVSNPKIRSVVNPENERFIIQTISIEGGEKIKILGSDFMEGARVVFNPQLKLVEDEKQATGDIITIGDKKYIFESGVPGTEIERIDGQTITVTTPPGKLGEKGVIVINPDKGATNIYNIVYGIPEIGAPFNVRAEVVFDQFIRVNWTGVSDAVEYEIHMSENGGKFEFIGTTELTSYAIQKLKPSTKYQFLVKAMGKYGSSKPIEESKSNIITTSKEIGPIDEQGKPSEKTQIKRNGTKADIIIGSKDFNAKGIIIDLTKGDLATVKDITIRIPASIVSSSPGRIQVLGKDYKMNFAPNVFKTSTLEANKSKSNAGVVFNVSTHNDNIDLKGGDTIVGGRYKLEAVTYVDKNLSKMDYINGSLNFILDQDPLIIKNRKLKNIKAVRYDDSSKTWVNINAENRLGLYTVIGNR